MACERDWIAQLDATFSLCCRGEWLALREGRMPRSHLLFFDKTHRRVPSTSVPWYKCLLFPIHGDPAGRCVVSFEDISKIVEVQDAMLGVKRFVNHRIRTVLNGLLGAVDLLVDPGDEEERLMAADLAQTSAHELAQVIDGLDEHFLASTCIDSDEKARVGDIRAIVSTCSQAFMIATPLVECTADGAQRLPIGTGRLGAIVSELMDNSVKFHPRHRPQMRFIVTSQPRQVRLVVEDDGGTLSKEQMMQLRIPFRATNQSVAEEISGHGLGLSQVSRVVLGAGGDIEYGNREDGPGVRVTMTFPTTDGEDSKNVENADIFADGDQAC
jgi:signal transduction histidine kinase